MTHLPPKPDRAYRVFCNGLLCIVCSRTSIVIPWYKMSWFLICCSLHTKLIANGTWLYVSVTVMNLAATHHTAHHPWTTSPIIHCTHTFPSTITPITQLSPITHLPWLPHHTCTSFTHSLISSTHTLTLCEVLFSPGYISERSPIHPAISVFHPGLPDLGSLNLCLWPRLLPGIVYVSALPLIFLFLPADLACLILPIKYCCKWIHSPLSIPYSHIVSMKEIGLSAITVAWLGKCLNNGNTP